jgi:hypothetical protein
MLFGFGGRHQPVKRGGLFGGSGLRGAALAGAGMLALRWWRNRRGSQATPTSSDRDHGRNPVHGWQ